MNPKPICFFDNEDEYFVVHEHCVEDIKGNARKIKDGKINQFYATLLEKMSN